MQWLRMAAICGLMMIGFSSMVRADFVVPSFRGEALTTYQQWDVFSSTTGPNAPDVANDNAAGTANVVETTGLAFVTGGGNIYSFAGATAFEVTVPDFGLGAGYLTNVVVQIRTQGTDVDTASLFFDGIVPTSTELLFEQALGGFGGVLRDWKFEWTGIFGSIDLHQLDFAASGSSMSLDRLAIDTQVVAVPEAGSLALGSCGVLLVAGLRRLRRRSSCRRSEK
ncbi:MAG: hypothetical protein U1D30_24200 [Planctomycetota bacterium]